MAMVKERYSRRKAERRFAHVHQPVEGDRCVYCGMPNDGQFDHQPPVYVLHRFANGGLVAKRAIRESFGEYRLVPSCTICNMGIGVFYGADDNQRRWEVLNWLLPDDRYPDDQQMLALGSRLIQSRPRGERGPEICAFPGVGRVIYIHALFGLADGDFASPHEFPEWLQMLQSELAEWLRQEPRRKSRYFLDMAGLESYDLLPHARDDPRGQFSQSATAASTHLGEGA